MRVEEKIILDKRSIELRKLIVRALIGGKRGHVGSSLSPLEIFRVLYDDVMKFDPNNQNWEARDRCILSKGHGCLALYVLLADKGFFSFEELDKFCHYGALLGGHAEAKVPGVEFSTGALGHGLSVGVGVAMALRMKKNPARVFVVLGDGEINEGSVWEAAMSASNNRLDNLVALIDYNKIQSYGFTHEVADLEPLVDKWKSFGFETVEVNGHDTAALRSSLQAPMKKGKPKAIVCHTIKGKGISYAENDPDWHHKSKVSVEDAEEMLRALDTV
jgi:transketolase